MNYMNKTSIFRTALLSFLILLANVANANEERSEVTGMYFYASWCAACKTLEPKLEEAKSHWNDSSFKLVKFDVSNKPKQHQAQELANTLKLGEKFEEIGVKTGFVVLVESKTGKELGRIKRSDSVEVIAKKVKAAETKIQG